MHEHVTNPYELRVHEDSGLITHVQHAPQIVESVLLALIVVNVFLDIMLNWDYVINAQLNVLIVIILINATNVM